VEPVLDVRVELLGDGIEVEGEPSGDEGADLEELKSVEGEGWRVEQRKGKKRWDR
jgi:hypothetical protein